MTPKRQRVGVDLGALRRQGAGSPRRRPPTDSTARKPVWASAATASILAWPNGCSSSAGLSASRTAKKVSALEPVSRTIVGALGDERQRPRHASPRPVSPATARRWRGPRRGRRFVCAGRPAGDPAPASMVNLRRDREGETKQGLPQPNWRLCSASLLRLSSLLEQSAELKQWNSCTR